jgi:hypothetical protein
LAPFAPLRETGPSVCRIAYSASLFITRAMPLLINHKTSNKGFTQRRKGRKGRKESCLA